MKPIWFFVGLILLAIGLVIFLTGIYSLFNPAMDKKVLSNLHPDIWWGGIMVVVGLIYVIKNRKVKIN